MRIAILGYGVEGKSSLKFLRKKYPNAKLEVRDKKLDKNYLKNLEKFDIVVRSPGIPYLSPEIQKAKKQGVKITSATKLFFDNKKGKVIGITGTKGKGTTATLLFNILKAVHKKVYLVGNIGRPMLDILPRLNKNSITILELSSFQLQDSDTSPDIAVVTDISPDHQDYHKNLKEYLGAKANIAMFQKKQDKVFYFADNKFSKAIALHGRGQKMAISPDHNLVLKIPGFHNVKNASMAAAVGRSMGAPKNIIKKVIRNFKGLAHRIEFVKEINGVKFYNDSASTNPAATIAALKAFSTPKILIAGGAGKNLSYKPLAEAIQKTNTCLVILFGRDKHEIKKNIKTAAPVKLTRDLKSAVVLAKKYAKKGDVVILSPAAASFDMFKNYAERGKIYKNMVRGL